MDKNLLRKLAELSNSDRYEIIDIYTQPQWVGVTVATENDAEQLCYDLENIWQVHEYGVRVSWKDFSDFDTEVEPCGDWKVVIIKDVDFKGKIRFSY